MLLEREWAGGLVVHKEVESSPGFLGGEVKKTSKMITVVLLESRSDCTSHNP